MKQARQLSLDIKLSHQATYDNFYAPEDSAQYFAKSLLKDDSQQFICLTGDPGSGLSHLLQATCQQTSSTQHTNAMYLPLDILHHYDPEQVMEGLEFAKLICLDDLQSVAHKSNWQVPLFNLFNNCRQMGSKLVFASHRAPENLGIQLPDLLSRLKSGLLLHLPSFTDDYRKKLLQYRGKNRGLHLSDEVTLFLLNRLPRDNSSLMQALETLDNASLQAQRRLTVPFVKLALNL